jgi:hypothetical protein
MKRLIANDYGRLRGLEVVRGWFVFLLVLSLFAGVSLALWALGETVGLLAGLAVLAAVVITYARSSTQ